MNLEHFYEDNSESNYGVIKNIIINEDDGSKFICCSVIGNYKYICLDFEPKIGDKVELLINIDPDDGGWYLKKLEI